MATDNLPGDPSTQEVNSSDDRITVREKKISVPLWEVVDQLKQLNIKAKHAEQGIHAGSNCWLKWETLSTILFSLGSLIISVLTYFILSNQLQTSHLDQRAWIKIEHNTEPSTENGPLNITFTITNTGKTPARHVEQRYDVQKVPWNQPPNLVSPSKYGLSAGLLSPNSSIKVTVPLPKEKARLSDPYILTKKDLEELVAGKYYIAGIVTTSYVDIYGVTHSTNFCGYSSLAPNSHNAAKECVEYNDSDNN